MASLRKLQVMDLGLAPFRPVWKLQKELAGRRAAGKIPDTLLLVEHPAVITIGRRGTRDHLLCPSDWLEEKGIEILEVDRGGDITFHGPGQVVVYPILNLNEHFHDLHRLLYTYEQSIMDTLGGYRLKGEREQEYPGVWCNGSKIAAVGIGVSRWVTYHGLAFNVNIDLNFFNYIIPCGIASRSATSLSRELGAPVAMEAVKRKLAAALATNLGLCPIEEDCHAFPVPALA